MNNIISFNCTEIGASHITKGKPCQDYSLSWNSDDRNTHIVIVCDGHGGDTYVRSDVGARIAAEVSLKIIRETLDCIPPTLLLDNVGAVTARPNTEDPLPLSHKVHETEEQIAQNELFYKQIAHHKKQDSFFTHLFGRIYSEWDSLITEDSVQSPFNEEELSLLGRANIEKAYGCTLMAFVRTPLYWFAFHIGDGKMLCLDNSHNWFEPVPWDCNCFLNVTTSLCANNPVPSFRYAFNGKGEFPIAVLLGSDGIDDSWQTMEKLQNFYNQTLSIFGDLGNEQAVKELKDYLPKLSEKGSRDDMSIAGIIDMEAIRRASAIFKKKEEITAKSALIEKHKEEILSIESNPAFISINESINDAEKKTIVKSLFEVINAAIKEHRKQKVEGKEAKTRIEELCKERKAFEDQIEHLKARIEDVGNECTLLKGELEELTETEASNYELAFFSWKRQRDMILATGKAKN